MTEAVRQREGSLVPGVKLRGADAASGDPHERLPSCRLGSGGLDDLGGTGSDLLTETHTIAISLKTGSFALTLQCPGGEAADEVFLEDEEEDGHRQRKDEHAGAHEAVVDGETALEKEHADWQCA